VVGFDLADPDDRLVVAGLELSYEAPITLEDDAATVAVRVPSLGRSSFGMRYRLSAGGTVAATAETTQVAVTEAGDARPLPDRWREAVAAYEGIDEGPR
jgi:acyl-CoA thioester hydrolase